MSPDRPFIGRPVRRVEDRRFLTGNGRYTDDLNIAGQAHGVFVRSPHPHAAIGRIDTVSAAAMPGVLLVLTGADLTGRVKPIPSLARTEPFRIANRDGSDMPELDQPALAVDKVRYLGEAVAFVVAETLREAEEAALALEVDYAPLESLVTTEQARARGAVQIWDGVPGNVSFDWEHGDAQATRAALDAARHVARVELVNNRIAPVFLEPRAAIAEHDAASGRLTLHAGSQTAHRMHAVLSDMLGIEPERLRVVTPDTGGGFGARGAVYPEMAVVLAAAMRLRRSVKWTASRSESFLSDTQSRDHVLRGELALDADGRFTALAVSIDWRHGAYVPSRGIWVIVHYLVPTLGGAYTIPCGHVRVCGVITNTTPLAAIRGVGRVEATYLIESLVDAAARDIGADPIELRRRNLVAPQDLPFTSVGGARYEACTFAPHLERALALAGWRDFGARRRSSRDRARLRGIGTAVYVENDGGAPSEFAEVAVRGDGTVSLLVGTQNFGMGHETAYAQVLADRLGLPMACIEVVDGDTDRVARGSGSHGSRSMRVGGAAIVTAADALVERGRPLAAELLQAAQAPIAFAAGRYRVDGSGRSVDLFQVAALAEDRGARLAAAADFEQRRESYSSGCHVCEVEIDPDTGRVDLLGHVMVTDVGRAINPLLVDGQMHGGAAQGIGQAAMECVRYDEASGQTLTGSLMDYALPRADDLPRFTTEIAETPETDNPLAVKGVGEGPTTGSLAAYMNALRDALASAGAAGVDMPATPEAVWQALRSRGSEDKLR